MSLHLLATRRSESRLGQWREQLGRRWKPRSAMLFDLFAATDRPEFLTVRPDGRDTAEATADGMDRDGRDYLRGLGRLRRLTPFARDLASGDCRSSVLLGDLTAEYQSAAITPYWGPWRVPCPFRRGFRAGAWGRGALWGARPVEGYW